MRRLACITVALLCLGGAASADEASNRDAAIRDASENLTLLRLPAGAVRVEDNPARDPTQLDKGGIGTASSPNQVVKSEFWRVPGNPWDVFAWLKKHAPATTRLGGYGGGGDRSGQQVWYATFERKPIREVMRDRELVVALAKAADGGTAVRADGVATWLVPRPATSQIPAGVQSVEVTIRGGVAKHATRFQVTDQAKVALITRMLNRLPLVQPTSTFISCPMDRGIRAHLEFRARDGSPVADAVADVGGCAFVALTVGGQKQPELFGWGLFADLEASVGHRIDLTPFTGSESMPEVMPVASVAKGKFRGVPFDVVAFNGGPRSGLCVEVFVAGVNRSGTGCLLHLRGKRTTIVLAPACYPRELTAFAVVGKAAATTKVRFDDGKDLVGRATSLPHATARTTIGLEGDHIVKLKHPAKVNLGYRGPFAFGFRTGVHPPDGGFSLLDYC